MLVKLLQVKGIARAAGPAPSATGIFTSPATRPLESVLIASPYAGCTARAKPVPIAVTMNSRRVSGIRGKMKLRKSSSTAIPSPKRCFSLFLVPKRRQHRKIFERGGVAHRLLTAGDFSQQAAHDFPGACFRKRLAKPDFLRAGDRSDFLGPVCDQLLLHLVGAP